MSNDTTADERVFYDAKSVLEPVISKFAEVYEALGMDADYDPRDAALELLSMLGFGVAKHVISQGVDMMVSEALRLRNSVIAALRARENDRRGRGRMPKDTARWDGMDTDA